MNAERFFWTQKEGCFLELEPSSTLMVVDRVVRQKISDVYSPTALPTARPTATAYPTASPTTFAPSLAPTISPLPEGSVAPSLSPSYKMSLAPSLSPSVGVVEVTPSPSHGNNSNVTGTGNYSTAEQNATASQPTLSTNTTGSTGSNWRTNASDTDYNTTSTEFDAFFGNETLSNLTRSTNNSALTTSTNTTAAQRRRRLFQQFHQAAATNQQAVEAENVYTNFSTAVTKSIVLSVVPGVYKLCYSNDGLQQFSGQSTIVLTVTGATLQSQQFTLQTGQSQVLSFKQPQSFAKFSGDEKFFWVSPLYPAFNCSNPPPNAPSTAPSSAVERGSELPSTQQSLPDSSQSLLSSLSVMYGMISSNGKTTPLSAVGVLVGDYTICYSSGPESYAAVPGVVLSVTGVNLADGEWVKYSGEKAVFQFNKKGVGMFGGFERMFWAESGTTSCQLVLETSQARLGVGGVMVYNLTTNSLRNVLVTPPLDLFGVLGGHVLCFDDGSGTTTRERE